MSDLVPAMQATPVPNLASANKPQSNNLTPAQQKIADEVLAYFSKDEYELPVKEGDKKLIEEEKFWLTYECMLRYCRATRWESAKQAIKRLEETLQWRREFGLYDERFTPEHVEPEAVTGKEIIYGYDVNGRPALYLCPNRQNTEETIRQVEFTMFALELCINLMGPGVESLALMIDYGQKGKSPSFSQSRTVLNILQSHYPERLGRALIINMPWMINTFYKLINPFLDPVTREKIRFNPKAVPERLFAADSVWKEFGGIIEFTYEHKTYWPDLIEMTKTRRDEQMRQWRELGARVGLREWDIKDGDKLVSAELALLELDPAID
ncbi:uncharacterized protein PHACADRAFT_252713 [Phanerochaete carnosa HHB-10118-sp]|uniref:CRAL-TRIO domain-containing protein n=1 Tax=Phanerochaete carnosa (strain HHB-10118-sp) TaxID=650164 RepID=K5W3H6_PHACS|nr:uncharacterized protein PHACADRAFT_252713 [Phanerochaete carnosa HHB-10118-sp]EKM58413.1 hypothetical protein PHACADRAFT_252713 [Phanerochaete carnosa HHB-10118-sp]